MKQRSLATSAVLAVLFACSASAQTRFHEYTAKYKNPPNPATPVAAGYIGGNGDEYLSGGAFLANGSVLLAGTCVGPQFNPAGIRVTVIGSDGQAPASPVKETKDKKGRARLETPNWEFTDGAGFILQLGPDYKTVVKAIRFPWSSGTLTDIVSDGKSGIYVTGTCGPAFGKLVRAEKMDSGLTGKGSIFFGRMKSDLSGFEWCYLLEDDLWTAPKLKLLKDGKFSLIASNAYHFSSAGKLLKATKLQTTSNWSRGVDPVTHSTATGGDSNTSTGWEPWRQPVLFIFNDKGEHTDEFYRWNPKLVGLNCFRLVSDSDVRVLSYDNEGNLLVVGWSDGGNSVFEYSPYDLKRSAYPEGTKGLGFSLWGAGVGSFCHIMKIDPRSGEPLGKTIFVGYLKSKNVPSGLGVDTVDSGVDDTLLMGGGSAYGLIETGNKVNTMDWQADDYIGGPFVAILTPKMDSIRFSSCMPGGGNVDLTRHNKGSYGKWGIGSGSAGGKPMALFVCGARQAEKFKMINCPQKEFGGGKLDGQYVILEL